MKENLANVLNKAKKYRIVVSLCVFLTVSAILLLTEHRAHFLGALPYLLLLACPLMHLFMHHGHGGHYQRSHDPGPEPQKRGEGKHGFQHDDHGHHYSMDG